MLLKCHENTTESETELEEYDLPKEEDAEFSEPEIVAEDVEFEMSSDSINHMSYNLDVFLLLWSIRKATKSMLNLSRQ